MRAKENMYAVDQLGVRRLVVAGDEIPDGWQPEDDVEDETPEKAPAKRAPAKKPRSS
jgi:hypothetical protein